MDDSDATATTTEIQLLQPDAMERNKDLLLNVVPSDYASHDLYPSTSHHLYLSTSAIPLDVAAPVSSSSAVREFDSGYELASLSSAPAPDVNVDYCDDDVAMEMTSQGRHNESSESVMTVKRSRGEKLERSGGETSSGSVDSFLSLETGTDVTSDDATSTSNSDLRSSTTLSYLLSRNSGGGDGSGGSSEKKRSCYTSFSYPKIPSSASTTTTSKHPKKMRRVAPDQLAACNSGTTASATLEHTLPTSFSVSLLPQDDDAEEHLPATKLVGMRRRKATNSANSNNATVPASSFGSGGRQISSVTKPKQRHNNVLTSPFSPTSCVFNIDDVIDDTQDAVRELINTSAAIDHVMRVASEGIDAALEGAGKPMQRDVTDG